MMKIIKRAALLLLLSGVASADTLIIDCPQPWLPKGAGYECPPTAPGTLPPAVGFEIRTDSTIAFTDIFVTRRKTDISKAIRIEVRKGETVTVNGIAIK